jgi:hypothetical protein
MKMKIKSLFVAVLLMAGVVVAPAGKAAVIFETPKQVSFTVSSKAIDLATNNSALNFELVVSHPIGIQSRNTTLHFSGRNNGYSFETQLKRVDNPVNFNLQKVTFRGSLTVPSYVTPDIFYFYADPIDGFTNSNDDLTPKSEKFYPEAFNDFYDATKSVLVRVNGKLNLATNTFVGPTHTSINRLEDSKPRTLFPNDPVFRVGEVYDPTKYFEIRVPNSSLVIESRTPKICTSDLKILKFNDVGDCVFKVFMAASNDYLETSIVLSAAIIAAKNKLSINIANLPQQTVATFPKQIQVPTAYNTAGFEVMPTSTTPLVCLVTAINIVQLFSVGTCTLSYSADGGGNYSSSDPYLKSFEIIKEGQPVVVPTPQPTTTPTPTATPVIKKTISCVKGKKTVTRTGSSPKCPAGYKLKK